MNAKELRLGNHLQTLDGSPTVVTEILTASNYTDTYFWCFNYSSSEVKPIELTEDLLIKSGFKKVKPRRGIAMAYLKNGIRINISNSLNFYYKDMGLYSFHQLQNLYFALKNEELCQTLDL